MSVLKSNQLRVLTTSCRTAFHKTLLNWYKHAHRKLPWRETSDPYAISLSEFMLQQTQVTTVLPYYIRWLETFPNWQSLAKAPEAAVLKAWEGLGYYSRARNLHKLAKAVVALPKKQLPHSVEELEKLPGVGPYTARAIASFAFKQKTAVLDGNVIRILTRIFAISDDTSQPAVRKKLWDLIERLAPEKNNDLFNQAIMELGAMVCTPRKPQCLVCPMNSVCKGKSEPEKYPVKKKAPITHLEEKIALLTKDSRWWAHPYAGEKRLKGLWRFPVIDEATMKSGAKLHELAYSITRYRVKMSVHSASWKNGTPADGKWLTLTEMETLPFAAPHRKLASWLRSNA